MWAGSPATTMSLACHAGSGQRGEIEAIGDDSPTLRPDWEAGPKHRGEKDDEDRDDTEVEEVSSFWTPPH